MTIVAFGSNPQSCNQLPSMQPLNQKTPISVKVMLKSTICPLVINKNIPWPHDLADWPYYFVWHGLSVTCHYALPQNSIIYLPADFYLLFCGLRDLSLDKSSFLNAITELADLGSSSTVRHQSNKVKANVIYDCSLERYSFLHHLLMWPWDKHIISDWIRLVRKVYMNAQSIP